jgi:hypothetical protein
MSLQAIHAGPLPLAVRLVSVLFSPAGKPTRDLDWGPGSASDSEAAGENQKPGRRRRKSAFGRPLRECLNRVRSAP